VEFSCSPKLHTKYNAAELQSILCDDSAAVFDAASSPFLGYHILRVRPWVPLSAAASCQIYLAGGGNMVW